MTMELACRRCFAAYEIDRGDIMQGYQWWSLCPGCRESDANELPRPEIEPDPFECGESAQSTHVKKGAGVGISAFYTREKAEPVPQTLGIVAPKKDQTEQTEHPKKGATRTKLTAKTAGNLSKPDILTHEDATDCYIAPTGELLANVGDLACEDGESLSFADIPACEGMLKNVEIPARDEPGMLTFVDSHAGAENPTKTYISARVEGGRHYTKLYKSRPPANPADFSQLLNSEPSEGGDAA